MFEGNQTWKYAPDLVAEMKAAGVQLDGPAITSATRALVHNGDVEVRAIFISMMLTCRFVALIDAKAYYLVLRQL